jgi:hypothetical protein
MEDKHDPSIKLERQRVNKVFDWRYAPAPTTVHGAAEAAKVAQA